MEAVLRGRPDITREHLERTRKLMDLHAAGSLVYGYERHLNKLNLPDPDDRPVLAAAIESGAETLLINARTSSHVQQVTPSGKEWRQGPRQMLPEGDAAAIHQVREAAGKDRIQHGGVPIAGVCFGLPIPWFSCGQHFQKTLHDRGVPDRRIVGLCKMVDEGSDGGGGPAELGGFHGVEGRMQVAFDTPGSHHDRDAETDIVHAGESIYFHAEGNGAFLIEEDGLYDIGSSQTDRIAGVSFFPEYFDAEVFGAFAQLAPFRGVLDEFASSGGYTHGGELMLTVLPQDVGTQIVGMDMDEF